jgi:hypothetical protein
MTRNQFKKLCGMSASLVATFSLIAAPATALTAAASGSGSASDSSATANASATTAAGDKAKVTFIINHGDTEIARRLSALNALSAKITATTKLTSADQSALSSEVSTEVSGLTSLKATLDADTDLTNAKADGQSIITDYRVFALIVPKVDIVKTADDQQVAEGKLSALAPKLQSRITTAQTAGKSVTSLQTQLNDLTTKIGAALTISSTLETNVISLQPSDYNSDTTVLSGDRDQLKTAQADIQAALSDAKGIVASLKSE